jgi:tRNA-specific 2-thiouridylase
VARRECRVRVAVAMSGGVDSSVAAALLLKAGYEVIGLMLRLWSEDGCEDKNRCCTPEAMALARRVAATLGIPFYVLDAQEPFHASVVQPFIDDYSQGLTPNPCIACNRNIRWGFLLNHARMLGARYLATGHYARLRPEPNGAGNSHACIQLLTGVDQDKDQSYVLHSLDPEQLKHTLLPLGKYTKPQVRQLARELNLPVADRADSQDLCFLGEGDYRDFLLRHAPQVENPGPILTRLGQQIGEHRGLAFYTIGQRKGLGIFSPMPLYVLSKDLSRNALIVGRLEELGGDELIAGPVNWICGTPPTASFRAQVKIRYKALPAWGDVTLLDDGCVKVHFDEPLRDITPGQAAVFYSGEICLGGGPILA